MLGGEPQNALTNCYSKVPSRSHDAVIRAYALMIRAAVENAAFISFLQENQGDGVAVVKEKTINGGDLGYIYRGSFEVTGKTLVATLNIKRWNQYVASIFGNIAVFDLKIEGQVSSDLMSFSGQGFVVQNPEMRLMVNARRIDDAA